MRLLAHTGLVCLTVMAAAFAFQVCLDVGLPFVGALCVGTVVLLQAIFLFARSFRRGRLVWLPRKIRLEDLTKMILDHLPADVVADLNQEALKREVRSAVGREMAELTSPRSHPREVRKSDLPADVVAALNHGVGGTMSNDQMATLLRATGQEEAASELAGPRTAQGDETTWDVYSEDFSEVVGTVSLSHGDVETTHSDGEELSEYEVDIIRKQQRCPDCVHEGFLAGPQGGGSQNFKCANDSCGSRFNDLGMFGIERISDASPDKPPSDSGSPPYRRHPNRYQRLMGAEARLVAGEPCEEHGMPGCSCGRGNRSQWEGGD